MPSDAGTTPWEAGYRWPAEWEPHDATWIAWPHNRDTWPGRFEPIPALFAELIRTVSACEHVHVLAGTGEVLEQARRLVGHLPQVTLHAIATNDAWVRDFGPTFLIHSSDHKTALVDWQFNAWGGKYPPWDRDNAVSGRIARQLQCDHFSPEIVLEGGAIDGNGSGVVLTTESCLLDPRRNAGVDRAATERYLRQYLGARQILWIPGGPIMGDDTDGHVDQLARFVGPRRIVAAVENDPADGNFRPLRNNLSRLHSMRDPSGQPMEIIPLPMPRPVTHAGQRVPASYCNFYIANQCVIVPLFDDPADDQACQILSDLFPDRNVIGLPAREIVWGLGAFHCLTQQQPREKEAKGSGTFFVAS